MKAEFSCGKMPGICPKPVFAIPDSQVTIRIFNALDAGFGRRGLAFQRVLRDFGEQLIMLMVESAATAKTGAGRRFSRVNPALPSSTR